jgi:hypothetical protein
MSKIAHVIFSAALFPLWLSAEQNFKYEHRFVLKKDEPALVLINHKEVTKKPTADNPNNEYLLRMRWTLFTNNMLTLLVNYRGYPTQYVLEKKYPLQNVVIPLLPVGINPVTARTYAKIEFNDFNQSARTATLNVFIADQADRVEVEFRPKKKE